MFSVQTGGEIGAIPVGDAAGGTRLKTFFTGKTVGAILGLSNSAIFGTEPADGGEPLYGCDDPASNGTWHCRGYGGAQCVLQPCVRTYSCSIDRGRINGVTVEHSSLDQTWGYGEVSAAPGSFVTGDYVEKELFGLVDTQCISEDERQRLKEEGYDTDITGRWLPYNTTFDPSKTHINASSPFP